MAKNDVILVDGIVDQRVADCLPSDKRDEVFEYLVLEQLLKDYDLAQDEIESGWVDGGEDGGIDGFYTFVNGHLVDDATSFPWPKVSGCIEVWIVTCKHHATFQQAPVDALLASAPELFDFSRDESGFHGKYSSQVLEARRILAATYRRLSITRASMLVRIVYGSRGDSTDIGETVAARGKQLQAAVASFFSSTSVEMSYFGAAEIVQCHRRAKLFSLDLPFSEHLATGRQSYVMLVKLKDYCAFVTDEKGSLRRYLFDSNVRDYLGPNSVNEDIARSLGDNSAPDFWWLNNGVTILATNASTVGKTIQLQDIQIVNGLQTTETVYRHFSSGSETSSERSLLVKIIISTDAVVRDQIIRATNNQTLVQTDALHATDKIQRDIEQILEQNDWYYERRKNYYKNIGKPSARFVTPGYIASAVVALVFKNPSVARRIKTKRFRDPVSYRDIFSDRIPITLWPVMVSIFKMMDIELSRLVSSEHISEKWIAELRPLTALLVVARIFRTFDYSNEMLHTFKSEQNTDAFIRDVWTMIFARSDILTVRRSRRTAFDAAIIQEYANKFGIEGLEVVGRRDIKMSPPVAPIALPAFAKDVQITAQTYAVLSEDVLAKVDAALPNQPWPPGIHREIAKRLGISKRMVSAAITTLMLTGKRMKQLDGVVYDTEGNEVARDPSRRQPSSDTAEDIQDGTS